MLYITQINYIILSKSNLTYIIVTIINIKYGQQEQSN